MQRLQPLARKGYRMQHEEEEECSTTSYSMPFANEIKIHVSNTHMGCTKQHPKLALLHFV